MDIPKYYSQNGEDFLLWTFFGGKGDGFYVDIGAFDGIHLSNTYTFEKMGWQGICVEPNPKIFDLCKSNRPNAVCLNAVCVGKVNNKEKKITFYIEKLGLLSSTIGDGEKLEDIKRRYEKRGLTFTGMEKLELPASSLDEIIDRYAGSRDNIDFVSIDTEGNELDILTQFDFRKRDIRVMVIEYDKENHRETKKLMMERGGYFPAVSTPHNIIFVKTQQDCEKIKRIPITCLIEKQLHPLGRKYTPPVFCDGKVIVEGKMVKTKCD